MKNVDSDVFECFGTSYAVYDHFDGISLRDFLLRSKTGYISWEKARQLLMPTLSTIGNLHSNGIIHRGISPTTLIIAEDGKIKITGFSIGEVRTAGSHLDPQIYEGYAAVEQYGFDAPQGPWTDVYSFAAVLYRTLIGSDPISAKERRFCLRTGQGTLSSSEESFPQLRPLPPRAQHIPGRRTAERSKPRLLPEAIPLRRKRRVRLPLCFLRL